MDRIKQLALNKSARIKNAGAHMYHAATAVTDGGEAKPKKSARLKKEFARYRGYANRDVSTHHYGADIDKKSYKDKDLV